MTAHREKIYCAFCKNPKYIRTQKHLNWTNGLICLVAALATMFILWQQFDARFIIFLSAYLGLAEIFTYLSWRVSVRCDSCAFDPVLYRSSPERAAAQVKEHLRDMRDSGKYLMKKNNPFTHLPVQKKKVQPVGSVNTNVKASASTEKRESTLLSRQI